MKWLLLVLMCGTAMAQQNRIPEDARGSNLFENCQADIRSQNTTAPSGVDLMKAADCTGYIDGFLDGLEIGGAIGGICFDGAAFGTIARVYVAYMEKNPKMLDAEKSAGMADAVLDAYSCSLPKKR